MPALIRKSAGNSAKITKIVVATGTDEALLKNLRTIFFKTGATMIGEARYGKQAVALVQKNVPDIIIIDVETTRGAAWAIAQISAQKVCPVIILTDNAATPPPPEAFSATAVFSVLNKTANERLILNAVYVAVARWREISSLTREVAELKETIAARKIIDRAKGVLMSKKGIGEQEAYRLIQRYAMKHRFTMKEVAEKILSD